MIRFSKKGFTLIELIVVIAVLLFVVGAAIGIFISIVKHQRRILDEQELLNQASYVLEHMSKALRMAGKESSLATCLVDSFGTPYPGYNYLLTRPINGIYTGIKFINQSDINEVTGLPVCQEFYLDNEDINNPVLKEIKDNSPWVALTSDKFMVNSIRFGINGESGLTTGEIGARGDNNIQPRITIYLDVQTKIKGDDGQIVQSAKEIQTTVSQRDLNVQQ